MPVKRKLILASIALILLGGLVLAATFALSPVIEGINIYAVLAFVLAPLFVSAILVSVGLTSVLMAFVIPEKFCIECGQTIDLDSRFCKYCGHEYKPGEAPAA